MSQGVYDPTLTEWLQSSAEYIANKPKGQQVDWILFLLDELKSVLAAQDYADLLQALSEAINQRLA
jgi:hypothetical protein